MSQACHEAGLSACIPICLSAESLPDQLKNATVEGFFDNVSTILHPDSFWDFGTIQVIYLLAYLLSLSTMVLLPVGNPSWAKIGKPECS